MNCPYCGHQDTKVLETRAHPAGSSTRRRRRCALCEEFFYTLENLDTAPIIVAKRHGTREDFDRKRLVDSLAVAGPRSLEEQQRESIADAVIARLRDRGPLVTSYEVGETVLACVKDVDVTTYIRYALSFKRPRDAQEFASWLSENAPAVDQNQAEESIRILKRDGTRQLFDRKLLARDIMQACRGREAQTVKLIDQELDTIEAAIRARASTTGEVELTSAELSKTVIENLKEFDDLVYLSYAIAHGSLDSYGKIQAELATLSQPILSKR